MQTLNILDDHFSEYNAFSAPATALGAGLQQGSALLDKLQITLDLERILNIFAEEASKYVDFSGLYFKYDNIRKTIRGSKIAKAERQFELKIDNQFIGMLTYGVNSPISLSNYKVLHQLHQYLVYPIRNAIAYYQAMQLAMQDSLTGLGNRRYFDEQLKRAMHHANRHHTRVGLVLGDLNKFKAVNDTFGHSVGDQVLVHFSDALRASIRDSDSIFRFGGDEFAVLVEDGSDQSLSIIEDRITQTTQNDVVLAQYKVSCSLGACFMNRADNEQSFFERTDQALYRKKLALPLALA